MGGSSRGERMASAISRVRELCAARGLPGVVLTAPGPVSWATSGMNVSIDRSAAIDLVWLAIGPSSTTVVTTQVEAPRIQVELMPADGLEPPPTLVAVPWWDADAMVAAAATALDAPAQALGADGHPAFGHDVSHDLALCRIALTAAEQDDLRALGRDAAHAVEQALREWVPGQTDRQVQGRVAGLVEASGADAPVLIVGGDDRVRSWRHPVSCGRPVNDLLMAVLVARRDGLHVALTRYAAAQAPDPALAAALDTTRAIHREVLGLCRPRAVVGDVMSGLAASYSAHGHPDAWRQHYQGGPIGYAQREFELAPGQTDSPWWTHRLHAGTALAWNPSVPGGAKDEDTYLLHDDAPELVTDSGQWPSADDVELARPGVLVAGA